jgi:hypothetical protein
VSFTYDFLNKNEGDIFKYYFLIISKVQQKQRPLDESKNVLDENKKNNGENIMKESIQNENLDNGIDISETNSNLGINEIIDMVDLLEMKEFENEQKSFGNDSNNNQNTASNNEVLYNFH